MSDDASAHSEAPWALRSVDDLCALVTSGGTPSRRQSGYFDPAVVPWIKTGDLIDGYITKYDEYISEEGVANSSAKLLPTDTVLMAMYGATVGRLGMLSEPATCNQAACAMVVDSAVTEPRWLFYVLLNDRTRIVSKANGAAQQNLSARAIREFRYPTPSLPEQRAIAEVLGVLDDKIAGNTKLASTADAWVRTAFAGAVYRSHSKIVLGKLVASVKNLVDPIMIPVNTMYVGLEHVPRRLMWLNSSGTVGSVTSTKFRFEAGDVLFGKLRPYFHKIVSAPRDGVCSTDVLVARPVDKKMAGFVLVAMASDDVVKQCAAASEGTRMPRTNWKDLAAIQVVWPGDQAVFALSEKITNLRDAVEARLRENEILADTRGALLPQLMSGKLRVKDAEKVAEEVL